MNILHGSTKPKRTILSRKFGLCFIFLFDKISHVRHNKTILEVGHIKNRKQVLFFQVVVSGVGKKNREVYRNGLCSIPIA